MSDELWLPESPRANFLRLVYINRFVQNRMSCELIQFNIAPALGRRKVRHCRSIEHSLTKVLFVLFLDKSRRCSLKISFPLASHRNLLKE